MSEMTSRRVHWFDVDVVGTMSIPSPGLDNVTAQAAVADDDDDDDDFALHPLTVRFRELERKALDGEPVFLTLFGAPIIPFLFQSRPAAGLVQAGDPTISGRRT